MSRWPSSPHSRWHGRTSHTTGRRRSGKTNGGGAVTPQREVRAVGSSKNTARYAPPPVARVIVECNLWPGSRLSGKHVRSKDKEKERENERRKRQREEQDKARRDWERQKRRELARAHSRRER